MKSTLQRVAHRGGAALAPENTLAAFRNALTLPGDVIELDVQMSRDGQVVVFHDASVERLTDGQGNILDLDFAYLRSLNAAVHFSGGWPEPQQIPTLREVFALVRNRRQVYVELKASEREGVYGRYPNFAAAVVSDLRATSMLKDVLIISFDWELLQEVRLLDERVQTGAIVARENWSFAGEQTLESLAAHVAKLGVRSLHLDYKLFTEDMPERLHALQMKLGLWTVNTLPELQRLAALGVDSLTTDRPDLFASLE